METTKTGGLAVFRLVIALIVTIGTGLLLFLTAVFATDSGTAAALKTGYIIMAISAGYTILSLLGIALAYKKSSLMFINTVIYTPIILYILALSFGLLT